MKKIIQEILTIVGVAIIFIILVGIYTWYFKNQNSEPVVIVPPISDNKKTIDPEMQKEIEEVLQGFSEYLESGDKNQVSSNSALNLSTIIFIGNGTEPFWSFTASGSQLILMEPSDTGPMNQTHFSGITMTQSGSSLFMSGSGVTLTLTQDVTCSDGMSDLSYDYSSVFIAGTTNYSGCANIQ